MLGISSALSLICHIAGYCTARLAAKGAPVGFLSKFLLLPFSHYYKPFNLDVN